MSSASDTEANATESQAAADPLNDEPQAGVTASVDVATAPTEAKANAQPCDNTEPSQSHDKASGDTSANEAGVLGGGSQNPLPSKAMDTSAVAESPSTATEPAATVKREPRDSADVLHHPGGKDTTALPTSLAAAGCVGGSPPEAPIGAVRQESVKDDDKSPPSLTPQASTAEPTTSLDIGAIKQESVKDDDKSPPSLDIGSIKQECVEGDGKSPPSETPQPPTAAAEPTPSPDNGETSAVISVKMEPVSPPVVPPADGGGDEDTPSDPPLSSAVHTSEVVTGDDNAEEKGEETSVPPPHAVASPEGRGEADIDPQPSEGVADAEGKPDEADGDSLPASGSWRGAPSADDDLHTDKMSPAAVMDTGEVAMDLGEKAMGTEDVAAINEGAAMDTNAVDANNAPEDVAIDTEAAAMDIADAVDEEAALETSPRSDREMPTTGLSSPKGSEHEELKAESDDEDIRSPPQPLAQEEGRHPETELDAKEVAAPADVEGGKMNTDDDDRNVMPSLDEVNQGGATSGDDGVEKREAPDNGDTSTDDGDDEDGSQNSSEESESHGVGEDGPASQKAKSASPPPVAGEEAILPKTSEGKAPAEESASVTPVKDERQDVDIESHVISVVGSGSSLTSIPTTGAAKMASVKRAREDDREERSMEQKVKRPREDVGGKPEGKPKQKDGKEQ